MVRRLFDPAVNVVPWLLRRHHWQANRHLGLGGHVASLTVDQFVKCAVTFHVSLPSGMSMALSDLASASLPRLNVPVNVMSAAWLITATGLRMVIRISLSLTIVALCVVACLRQTPLVRGSSRRIAMLRVMQSRRGRRVL